MLRHGPLLAAALALCLVTSARGGVGLDRWAIVASSEIRNSGLSDLVLVQAGKRAGREFVERDQLDRVTGELELQSLAGARAVSERLEAGRLLRADALVLMHPVSAAESKRLRIVICDCRHGTRLSTWETGFEKATLDRVARQVAAEIDRVQDHFADGVQLVIGVTPFVSRNLEHRYDHWQSRYADLLSRSIECQPGMAVIEVEEARAILKERLLVTDDSVERGVPFIVSGRFRMTAREGADEPDVDLTIDLATAESERQLATVSMELSRSPTWLVEKLTPLLLKAAGRQFTPLDSRQQRRVLIRQATAFSQLGEWTKSLGLREAALMLEPTDAEQRVRVIQEYQLRFIQDFERLRSSKIVADGDRAALLERTCDDFILAQDHLEYLIRNRRLSRDEALTLFRRQKWEGQGSFHPDSRPRPDEVEQWERVLDAEQRLVTDTFPAILLLPEIAMWTGIVLPRRHQFPEPWWESLLWRVGNQVRFRQFDANSLTFLGSVLTRMVPADMPESQPLEMVLHEARFFSKDQQTQDWRKFLEGLSQSKHEAARCLGRAELWELSRLRAGDPAKLDNTQIQALVTRADSILQGFESSRPVKIAGYARLQQSRKHLQSYLDGTRVINSPPGPPVWASHGRLRFQPLDWTVSPHDAADTAEAIELPLLRNLRRCGEELDVYWNEKSLFFMNRPGELRTVPISGHPDWSKRAAFSHVTWDGEFVWLVVAGRGIHVLESSGDVVARFTSDTPIPGIGAGLQMLPLGPRRMLAIGSFGEHHRAWCGVLEVSDQNQPLVRVFHEATRVADQRTEAEADGDIETAFQPTWIHQFHSRDGTPMAFVGRDRRSRSLAIDLNSFAVSLVSFEPRGYGANDAFFSNDGNLVQLTGGGVYQFEPFDPGSDVKGKKLIPIPIPRTQMLLHADWAYITGRIWWRIETQTLQVEKLFSEQTELPRPYRDLRFGVSTHHGLIGFRQYVPPKEAGSPAVYRIEITESPR